MQKVLDKIDELNESYIALWEQVCNLESPTADKKGVDAVGNCLKEIAIQRGWQIRTLPHERAGEAFSFTINPDAAAAPVVFSGHIDTVHPVGLFGQPAVRMDEEKIYGPGVMDCKGGVIASLLALDALWQCGFTKRPVKLVVQTDEETSSITSDRKTIDFILEEANGAAAFLNTEGMEGNGAALMRKGIYRCRFIVKGKAAHSSRCVEGANAVTEAAYKIIELEKLKDAPGLTCNCGVISGGTVANTVAETCTFLADIRFADNEQYEQALQIVEKVASDIHVPGCSCTLETVSFRPAMPKTETNMALFEKMNALYREYGLSEFVARGYLGGSDAAYTTQAGIPTVDNLGTVGNYIHSLREYCLLSSLAESAKHLAAVAFGL